MKTARILAVTLLGAVSSLQAVENASAAGFEPPKKYGAERYMAGWERNPFSIPTPPVAPPPVESMFKDLAIKSVYGPKDNPIFSLVNTKTHERMRITMEKPTKDGIELKSFSLGDNRREATIEVTKGTETATLKYAVDYVAPAAGAAGRPGMVPGMPGAPGMPGGANRIPIPQVGANGIPNQQNRAIPGQVPGTVPPQNNRSVIGSGGGNAPVVVGGAANTVNANANATGTNATAAAANAAAAEAVRRRVVPLPGAATGATGSPAINLNGNSNTTPVGTTQPATTGDPGNISPPIVRPPPSIYLDGAQQR